jgi:hypothetical protein
MILHSGSREKTRRRNASSMAIGPMIRRSCRLRAIGCAIAAVLALASGPAAVAQSWEDAIDYTKLRTRLAGQVPNGAGVLLSMVEGKSPPNTHAYYVNTGTPEFNGSWDPTATPVQFTDGSGGIAGGISNHATGVANYFYGDQTSMTDGANQVVLYEVSQWLSGELHYNTPAQPENQLFGVQNHSWVIPTLGSTSQDQSALRRFDWTIEADDMTAVVGANNVANIVSAAHPSLLVHSYNAIVVGRSDGLHSRGVTSSTYGSGRIKPDIVGPLNITSHSTPLVGSAAALLREALAGTDGVYSEPIKAMLLAGATKQEFATYTEQMIGAGAGLRPWDRTPTRPLDDIFGAGELNVYNSYLIQLGGQHAGSQSNPTTTAGSYGWDYQNHKGNAAVGDIFYEFEIPEGSTAPELSIILAWNVEVTDADSSPGQFVPSEALQNLDLRLYDSSDSFLGTVLDQSISTVDNVEHIYQTDLQPGTYTLKVSGAADWDFGLAWRMSTRFDQVSADFDEDGDVDGADLLTWQRNFGKLLGAAHGDGDADGDGDVDGEDLTAVEGRVMPLPLAVSGLAQVSVTAIPEPSTLALAAGTLLAAGWMWRRGRRG